MSSFPVSKYFVLFVDTASKGCSVSLLTLVPTFAAVDPATGADSGSPTDTDEIEILSSSWPEFLLRLGGSPAQTHCQLTLGKMPSSKSVLPGLRPVSNAPAQIWSEATRAVIYAHRMQRLLFAVEHEAEADFLLVSAVFEAHGRSFESAERALVRKYPKPQWWIDVQPSLKKIMKGEEPKWPMPVNNVRIYVSLVTGYKYIKCDNSSSW